LGPGESQAIALALEINADALFIDERDGTKAARKLGLFATGTLGVLEMAAKRGWLSLPDAIDALHKTAFRCPEKIIEELLRNDEHRQKRNRSKHRRKG
jgi:predicted nucleic acid-binding protein